MRFVFFNLPYSRQVVRRYTCTYYADNFYLPPLELMSLFSVAGEQKVESFFVDAVAEKLSFPVLAKRLEALAPDGIVTLLGIETLNEDLECLKQIKRQNPGTRIICCGYLPTVFPEAFLEENPWIDFVLRGEPEESFRTLLSDWQKGLQEKDPLSLPLAERIYPVTGPDRIMDLDALPFPERTHIPWSAYHEFLCPQPFTTMLTSRGCARGCAFCIPTYGRKVIARSVGNVLEEMRRVISDHHVRMIRFMDDDFCFDRRRVADLCQGIIDEGLDVAWSCLACPQNLDEEILTLMCKAGCRRIYVGVETFSERLLSLYGKRPAEGMPALVKIMHALSMQCVGFFLVGGKQTGRELEEDMAQAIECDFDHIIVSRVIPYPGTALFETQKQDWNFSLFPYHLRLKDVHEEEKFIDWERRFYRKFYFRGKYFGKQIRHFFQYPLAFVKGFWALCRYHQTGQVVSLERRDLQ